MKQRLVKHSAGQVIWVSALLVWAAILGGGGCGRKGGAPDNVAPPQTPTGPLTIKGFKIPAYEKALPGQAPRLKSLLMGAEAQPLPNNQVRIQQLQVVQFTADGKTNLVVRAPECRYDSTANTASSDGELMVTSGDGRLSIQGKGFTWYQTNSSLVISNQSRTRINQSQPIEVLADQLLYDATANRVDYRGQVRIIDPQLEMASDRLTIKLREGKESPLESAEAEGNVVIVNKPDQSRATGQRANYQGTAEQDTVELAGNPTWQRGLREGKADLLRFERQQKIFTAFTAVGHSYTKMPRSEVALSNAFSPLGLPTVATNTLSATNQFIEVFADEAQLRPASGKFVGNVLVKDGSVQGPAGTARGNTLTLTSSAENKLQGQPGFVDADLGDISGLAARLSRQADPLSQYLGRQFSDSIKQDLAKNPLGNEATLRATLLNELNRLIQAGALYEPARFAGVNLSETTQQLLKQNPEGEKLVRLNRLLLQDAYPSELSKNQLDYLVMEENVSLEQGDSRVTGERMVYAKTNDLATVTGQPTWQMGPQEGAGEMLQFRPESKALTAYTNALMRLHLGAGGQQLWAAFGATTNSAATNRSLLVQSAWYEYQPGKAEFHDRVITTSFAGAEAQGRLASDQMRVRLSIPENQVQELVADREVMFERGTPGVTNGPNAYQKITCEKVTAQATNGVMENLVAEGNLKFEQGLIHGTSQRGVYLYKDDTVVLLGDVHIISPEGEFKGPAFLIDRRQNRFFSRTGWTLMGYLKSHERAKP